MPLNTAGRRVLQAELVAEGRLLPVEIEGIRGPALHARRGAAAARAGGARGRGRTPAGRGGARASRSWPRSTRSSGTANSCAACTGSTTSGRSTSRPRSGAGATTSCRSCSAIDSSGGSSRGSSGRPTRSGSRVCGGRTASTRSRRPGSSAAFAAAIEAHRAFGGVATVAWPRTARHRALVDARSGRELGASRDLAEVDDLRDPGAAVAGAIAGDEPELVAMAEGHVERRRRGGSCSTQTFVHGPPSTRRWTEYERSPDGQDLEADVVARPRQLRVARRGRRAGDDLRPVDRGPRGRAVRDP